jgi:hypothetical protein
MPGQRRRPATSGRGIPGADAKIGQTKRGNMIVDFDHDLKAEARQRPGGEDMIG